MSETIGQVVPEDDFNHAPVKPIYTAPSESSGQAVPSEDVASSPVTGTSTGGADSAFTPQMGGVLGGVIGGVGTEAAHDLWKLTEKGLNAANIYPSLQTYSDKMIGKPMTSVPLKDLEKLTGVPIDYQSDVQDAIKILKGSKGELAKLEPVYQLVNGVPTIVSYKHTPATPPSPRIDISKYEMSPAKMAVKHLAPAGRGAVIGHNVMRGATEPTTAQTALDLAAAGSTAVAPWLPKNIPVPLPGGKKVNIPARAIAETIGLIPVAETAVETMMPQKKAAGGLAHLAVGGGDLGKFVGTGKKLVDKLQPLLRAPAKTKEEIMAIAERMAPQVLGEYSPEATGKSLKQFQREKELEHVIKPNFERADIPTVNQESMVGKVKVGVPGDISRAHETIYDIAGRPLNSPSVQEGGPLYGLEGNFWASGKGAAQGVQNIVDQASRAYGDVPVIASTMKMPQGMNYAQHYADALMKNIDYSKTKNLGEFNDLVRKVHPTFAGIENPEEALLQMQQNPKLRTMLTGMLEKPKFTDPFGLPYGRDVLHAVSEPDLINLETGAGGKSMGEMMPGAKLSPSSHATYTHDIPGKFIGSSEFPLPYELEYPDLIHKIRQNPISFTTETGRTGVVPEFGRLKMNRPHQYMDQQYIDEIGQYQDAMRKLTGMAEGGKTELPPAENAARTQIIGTLPTYKKAADILAAQGATGQAIDFGAGLGKGAELLGAGTHTYEPFAQNWNPTFSNPKDIPSDAYNRLTNLNVLNVVPREMRDEIVKDIGRVIEPGGLGIITTRGADVMGAKGTPGPEPMSIITSRDTFQKGFNKQELEDYLKYMLGKDFEISKLNLGPAGALLRKLRK